MALTTADLARLGPRAKCQIYDQLTKSSKYRNQKAIRVMPNGTEHTFDSQKEACRYDQLAVLLAVGKIRDLRLQVQFTLQESYISAQGDRIRAVRYVADFTYKRPTAPDCDGIVHWIDIVEDVKGMKTKDYELKKKLMADKFGIVIHEVT